MKIWVDLANAPHVPFFLPIIEEFKLLGHEVRITARDFNQTIQLAEDSGLKVISVGAHGGNKNIYKIFNIFIRVFQLINKISAWKPDIAVSHNSYTQVIAGGILGCHVITLMDYEGQPANHIAFRLADRVIVPFYFPKDALRKFGAKMGKVIFYEGYKEQVYLEKFKACSNFQKILRDRCCVGENWKLDKNILVTVRTPATMAAYHQFQNNLFDKLLRVLNEKESATCLVLCRSKQQREEYKAQFTNLIFPEHTLPGSDLVYYSDLLISAGGTMNREAAVLGTPVYTIFGGSIPAVDKNLIKMGRMKKLANEDDIDRLVFEKKDFSMQNIISNPDLLKFITSNIIKN
jgi:uncharacterized protein